MPKSNKNIKHDGRHFKQKVATKFKIGNRKAGICANLMSNADLQKVLDDNGRKKFHNKARQVLAKRA